MPHTLAQKILQAHTDEEVREAGQIVNCHLSGVLANDIRCAMKSISTLAFAAALIGPAAAYGSSAARALVNEFGISTVNVSRVETDVYEAAYANDQIVTRGCWVNAYGDAAVVTRNQLIFVDANEVCAIAERRPRPD